MKKSHFQNTNNNPRNLLCKRMNLKKCPETCNRAHNINELEISICNKGANCNNTKCPFVHSHQEFNLVNKQNYYKQMYKYTNPYETDRTSVCRYSSIGCKIVKCRKAHTINELRITECDCFRNNCPFYHIERDAHITKQEYFERMKQHQNVISKSSNEMLCRYVDIGCQRLDCPYAHSSEDLIVHKCIFSNCKSNCVFMHPDEHISKQEYYERMKNYVVPLKPLTVICHDNNCLDDKCMFAHSFDEFRVSYCVRGDKCKKHCCPFAHPSENLSDDVYYQRMLNSMHPN